MNEAPATPRENLPYDLDEQTSPSDPYDPVAPLRFSHEEVDDFMYSLHRTNVSRPAKDNKLCDICYLCFDVWRLGYQHPANAGDSELFKVLEDMIPETSMRTQLWRIMLAHLDNGDYRRAAHMPEMQSDTEESWRGE